MPYKIKYNYDTGDSFSNECGLEGYIELEWNILDIAKANLQRIKEHYEQYRELNSYETRRGNIGHQSILEKNRHKDWFVEKLKPAIYINAADKERYNAIDKSQIKKCKDKGAIVGYFIDETTAKHQLILYTDDGKPFQFWAVF